MTRVLHLCLALGVIPQMLTSQVMVHPKPGRLPNQWYAVHEWLGSALLAITIIYWLLAISRTLAGQGASMLFPWGSAARLRDLVSDTRATMTEIMGGRLPADDHPRPLPAAVQGLGLLAATFLAASGVALMVSQQPAGGWSPALRVVKEAHEMVAPLMWAYLVLHPAIGLVHHLAGHRTLARMFGRR